MKLFVVAVSNTFHHIDKDQPVSLTGDGIILYPPADPNGMLGLHFAVVESDKKARDVGSVLKTLFADADVKSVMREIAKITAATRSVPAELLTAAMGAATTALAAALAANHDDILFSHNHSGLDFSSYGGWVVRA